MIEQGKITEMPKREHKVDASFKLSDDWRVMLSEIEAGIAPGMYVATKLTDAELEDLGLLPGTQGRRTVMRFVQKHIATMKLKHTLTVKSFHRDGLHHVYVIRPKAKRQ
jgi:hypothetical protein